MKKKTSIIKFSVVAFFIAVGVVLSFVTIPFGMYNLYSFTDSISLGLDLQGGIVAVYQATMPPDSEGELDNNVMQATVTRLSDMLMARGYTDATVVIEAGTRIRVEVPDVDDPAELFRIIGMPAQLIFRRANGDTILTGQNVVRATAGWDNASAGPAVFLTLNSAGATAFANATAADIGQQISIITIVDGVENLVSSPTVNEAITGGQAVISAMGTAQNAQNLVDQIVAGQFQVVLRELETASISPTLGENALMFGLIAGIIGLLLIIAFMCFFYRVFGVLSTLSVIGYSVLMLFFLAALPWVQLTLPGIAGILLSIGMSIDGNIIMFERIKDEYRNGKSIKSASHTGLKKGFWPVFDMEITTVIAAVVLLIFGTGPIQSFAITLLVGIALAMFFNLVVLRFFVRWFLVFNSSNPKWYNLKRSAEYAHLEGDQTDTSIAEREAKIDAIKKKEREERTAARKASGGATV